MKKLIYVFSLISAFLIGGAILVSCGKKQVEEDKELSDTKTPLHLLKPDYKTPYGQLSKDKIKTDMDRLFTYVDEVTPAKMVDGKINPGTYRLTSYEWGVMYDALLDAARITGDKRYSDYVSDRIGFLAREADNYQGDLSKDGQMRQVKNPLNLDDSGAMVGAWMRASMEDSTLNLDPYIENYWNIVETVPVRLADGTVARNRPHYNAVWLDDMFMFVPAKVVRSQYKNDPKQLDEAAEVTSGFIKRMWMPEKKIFRHGYVEGADFQPSMAWGRANGWAILAMSQLLDYLPEDHPRRAEIMKTFQDHAAGLANLQGIDGFWHQLLDHPETYDETSATAIFAYAIAHGVNEGWLDPVTFGPVAQLAWEAVSSKINEKGEVEDVVVGTGMGFDPAFYAYRPVSVKAAHGYGPTIWAGAEMIRLLDEQHPYINDSAVHYYKVDPEAPEDMPIFSLNEEGKATRTLH